MDFIFFFFFFSSRRRHTRCYRDWSSDVCSSDLSPRRDRLTMDADVIVVGAGLAGLVAAAEVAGTGRHAVVLEQEPEASLGGQAFWSFGGLLLIDSPEQRR